MSTDLSATPRTRFSIGRVLKDTFGVLRVNLLICATVAVVCIVLWQIAAKFADDPSTEEFNWWNFTVGELWRCILGGFATAALTYALLLTLSGGKPSYRDLVRGLSFAIPIMVVFFIDDLPSMISSLLGVPDSVHDRIIVVRIAVSIASYVLSVLWFAAAPAVVAEGLGPIAALRRSIFLTADRRWPIFGLIFAGGFVFAALGMAMASIANAVNVEVGHKGPNLISWIGDYVLPAIVLVFWTAAQTVMYCALRLAKQGVGVQELARVFD